MRPIKRIRKSQQTIITSSKANTDQEPYCARSVGTRISKTAMFVEGSRAAVIVVYRERITKQKSGSRRQACGHYKLLKSLVYADKPRTLDHLEDSIRRVIADIRPQMLEKSSKVGRPDWTTSEPVVAVPCQKS
ncbi:hypothetical protein TNCV_1804931 [Trichonephila clavipes]|nr:hypothetical protein TNCV_1804931 [Trichonephila clavipes]